MQDLTPTPSLAEKRVWIWDDGREIKEFRKAWNDALKDAGIKERYTPHTLRHNAITRWMLLGYHPREVMEMSGIKTYDVLMNTYSHIRPEDIVKDAERHEHMDVI